MVVAPDLALPLRLITPDQRLYTLSGNGSWPRTSSKVRRGGVRTLSARRAHPAPRGCVSTVSAVRRTAQDCRRDAGCGARLVARPDPRRRVRRVRRPRAGRCAATASGGCPTGRRRVRPTPCPDGLAACFAAGEYDGLLRAHGPRPQGARRRTPWRGRWAARWPSPPGRGLDPAHAPCWSRCRHAPAVVRARGPRPGAADRPGCGPAPAPGGRTTCVLAPARAAAERRRTRPG